jgi:hypothetical protein
MPRGLLLADAAGHVVIEIVGRRARIGSAVGLLGGAASIEKDARDLPLLAKLVGLGRERRIEWCAYVRGGGSVGPSLRYASNACASERARERVAKQ